MTLSAKSKTALTLAYCSRGKNPGQLLANCPKSETLAAAAWQGAMLFMNEEQRAVRDEVLAHFDALPREYRIMAQRDREALERLGVW